MASATKTINDSGSISRLACLRAVRPPHWTKNLLVFAPALISARSIKANEIENTAFLFLAFTCIASALYVVNDLIDLKADRAHLLKSSRPLARCEMSTGQGVALASLALAAGAVVSVFLPFRVGVALGGYAVLGVSYSLYLKRKPILDVFALASLYTLRILAGAVALKVQVSPAIVCGAFLFFLGLAICKRVSELLCGYTEGRPYEYCDISPLAIVGISAGVFSCFTPVFQGIESLSSCLICILLFYWISRLWLLAYRGVLTGDLVLFALRDRVTQVITACVILVSLLPLAKFPLEGLRF